MSSSMKDYLVHISAQMDGVQQALGVVQQLAREMDDMKKRAKKDGQHFDKLGSQIKDAAKQMTGFTKTFVKQLVGFASMAALVTKAARAVKQLVKDTVSLNDNLSKTAKELGKTQEQARLHSIALSAMGKTMDEINKDDKLKQTYDDLIKLGEGFQFKNAKSGITTLSDLNTELTKIKFTIRLGFSQTYEYFKAYAEKPLAQLKTWIENLIPNASGALDGISQTIGKGLAKALRAVMDLGRSAVKVGKQIFDWFKQLFSYFAELVPKSKAGALGIVAAIALILVALSPLLAVILAIWLLIDDFVAWSEGRASLFGDAWYKAFDVLQGAYSIISVGAKLIYDAVIAVHNLVSDIKALGNALGIDMGETERWDYIDPFDYENDTLYKMFAEAKESAQQKQAEREANSQKAQELEQRKASGGVLTGEEETWLGDYYVSQGRNRDGSGKATQNMTGDDILQYYFGGSNNAYPAYAGQTPVVETNTTQNETQVTVNATYNISDGDSNSAAAAANENLSSTLQHTMESAYQ